MDCVQRVRVQRGRHFPRLAHYSFRLADEQPSEQRAYKQANGDRRPKSLLGLLMPRQRLELVEGPEALRHSPSLRQRYGFVNTGFWGSKQQGYDPWASSNRSRQVTGGECPSARECQNAPLALITAPSGEDRWRVPRLVPPTACASYRPVTH